MTHYLVTWNIDVEADTPREAAEQAREMQRDGTTATVFYVLAVEEAGSYVEIDLLDE